MTKKLINNWWWVKKAPIGVVIAVVIAVLEVGHILRKQKIQ